MSWDKNNPNDIPSSRTFKWVAGAEYKRNNGESCWFIGMKRSGILIFEDEDGALFTTYISGLARLPSHVTEKDVIYESREPSET